MIRRRSVLKGLAALPLARVLADPKLARAAAETLQSVTLALPGGRTAAAALAVPKASPAPSVMLVHEWWGLNDQIKAVAAELAKDGYFALAIDLFDGKATKDPSVAAQLMQQVDKGQATEICTGWIDYLKNQRRGTGTVGTVGWCFGGGWSLDASIANPVDATVVYYGQVARSAEELEPLKGPVLGHFAIRDKWITADMVSGFEAAMAAAGKTAEIYWYEADHAFANPTGANYEAEEAALAWSRTLDFFARNLMPAAAG